MTNETAPVPSVDDARLRSVVIRGVVTALRTRPLHEVTRDVVAETSGVSVASITHAFPSWDGLLLATIDRWNEDRTGPLMPIAEQQGTVRFLRAIVTANIADPSLMRFLTATLNIAASPEHPLAPMLHSRWRRFHAFVQHALERDVLLGREPHTMEPARGSEQLLATYEGLQLQSMVRPEMDLLESFDRAVTRLREGWSRTYIAPVWDLDRVG